MVRGAPRPRRARRGDRARGARPVRRRGEARGDARRGRRGGRTRGASPGLVEPSISSSNQYLPAPWPQRWRGSRPGTGPSPTPPPGSGGCLRPPAARRRDPRRSRRPGACRSRPPPSPGSCRSGRAARDACCSRRARSRGAGRRPARRQGRGARRRPTARPSGRPTSRASRDPGTAWPPTPIAGSGPASEGSSPSGTIQHVPSVPADLFGSVRVEPAVDARCHRSGTCRPAGPARARRPRIRGAPRSGRDRTARDRRARP